MRRKTSMMLACAAAGGIWALTSAAHAAQNLTDNFNTGDVTDGGVFSTGAVNNAANVTFTEPPITGPLTIGVAAEPEGGYIQSTSPSLLDFTTGGMLMTLTAPVIGGVQQSLAPALPGNGTDGTFGTNALTLLGVDVGGANEGTYTGAHVLNTGLDKAYVAVNSDNSILFSLQYKDTTGPGLNEAVNYTIAYQHPAEAIPTGPNIAVTSMFLYLDAQDAANGNVWLNYGATWENTTTDTFTTIELEGGGNPNVNSYLGNLGATGDTDPLTGVTAYNIGNTMGPYYGSPSLGGLAGADQMLYNQFHGVTVGGVEVYDSSSSAPTNAVSFGQLSIQAPTVPEPATLGLLALGVPMLMRRKRQQT